MCNYNTTRDMNKLIALIILIVGLFACSERPSGSSNQLMVLTDIEKEELKYNIINLQLNNPIVLDSSDWVLYPLTLEEKEETARGYSSRSGQQYAYWNIAFYNTETKKTGLLSDSLKMLINSISHGNNAIVMLGGSQLTKTSNIFTTL